MGIIIPFLTAASQDLLAGLRYSLRTRGSKGRGLLAFLPNFTAEKAMELAQDNEKRICTLEQKVGM